MGDYGILMIVWKKTWKCDIVGIRNCKCYKEVKGYFIHMGRSGKSIDFFVYGFWKCKIIWMRGLQYVKLSYRGIENVNYLFGVVLKIQDYCIAGLENAKFVYIWR